MNIFSQIQTVLMLGIFFVMAIFVLLVTAFYLYKAGNKNKIADVGREKSGAIEDAEHLLPFDDIRNGMVIDDGGKRFTAAIICSGSDFFNDNYDEKVRKQNAYVGFWHTIRDDICYRESPESVDLSHTINKYKAARRKVESELYGASSEYSQMRNYYNVETGNGRMVPLAFENRMIALQKAMERLEWRISHIDDELRLCSSLSDVRSGNEKKQKAYIFSWFDKGGINGLNLEGEELERRAAEELDSIAARMIRSLSGSGVSARRATTEELIDMFRRVIHPVRGSLYGAADLMEETDWDGEPVLTDSVAAMNRDHIDDIADRIVTGL